VTFADRIGNAQRGIGPLHHTGMFPGSATPEEWITGKPEVELYKKSQAGQKSASRKFHDLGNEKTRCVDRIWSAQVNAAGSTNLGAETGTGTG
jgi:hypothetical protein